MIIEAIQGYFCKSIHTYIKSDGVPQPCDHVSFQLQFFVVLGISTQLVRDLKL